MGAAAPLATWLLLAAAAMAPAQTWQETCGRSPAGAEALAQAVLDVQRDALVLLVASHPDDRYVLPAAWLRFGHGVRVAVLLATRGGGGQNSLGPETGDAFERIRTLETEAGAARLGVEIWHLNLPDVGYRRSADEAFADWGRDRTQRELVRLLRTIRPDAVLTTHHREEPHGHDQALVAALVEALAMAGDAAVVSPLPPHQVRLAYLGASDVAAPQQLRVSADRFEPVRGASLRQLAHDVLVRAHRSPGAPGALETVFAPEFAFVPIEPGAPVGEAAFLAALPDGTAVAEWPGEAKLRAAVAEALTTTIPAGVRAGQPPVDSIVRTLTATQNAVADLALDDARRVRLERRIEALQRLLLLVRQIRIDVAAAAGAYAVAGEELRATMTVHRGLPLALQVRVQGREGLAARLSSGDDGVLLGPEAGRWQGELSLHVPPDELDSRDPMAERFRTERFQPPVRLRVVVGVDGVEVPVELTVPVELRPPVGLAIVPPMLLLPIGRSSAEFSVRVTRHSRHAVEGELDVRAPAGYVIEADRRPVSLRDQRGAMYRFKVHAPVDRRAGVDVLRVQLGKNRVELPVHSIDVTTRADLGVGLLRGNDDTLAGILGAGGLGIRWAELSDSDLAIADLSRFDTIVVDVRALRDRPEARRSFARVLEFARGAGRRLVVFYHKDTEFHPPGEGFVGAPYLPFELGRERVTRPDAPVRVLSPQHALLRAPNRIGLADWDGWEQERCLYLPTAYAKEYETLLEMADAGRERERGALLYARTGDGEYVYCALALWRQLKKLHPGAVRLLANLLTPQPR
jgi:LmbE family N-acetylglucosaminyl deacetylase